MSELELPKNPVELAATRAEGAVGQSFDILPSDEAMLTELDVAASELGFLGTRYYLNAHVGFQIPVSYDSHSRVTLTRFDEGLTVEAILATHAKLHIGRIIGGGVVRAVCFCFSEGFVLNRFTEIPDDQLLYVPVLAVKEIEEAA